ncbi:MAG: N-acetylmuramoyl-L-alanine amidase [Thermodesulfobacteriota bacterium]|nr:N-acetylmuramoyl-L-alanine amidase [Thermodesulfobacteriota bacterium]
MQETAIIIRFRVKRSLAALLVAGFVVIAGAALCPLARADAPFGKIIALDPGHGGTDTGTQGSGGLLEKEVTLALARRVAACLEPRYSVVLTRSGDYRLDGVDRAALANSRQADLFVSIHAGGGFSSTSGGITVFYRGLAPDSLLTSADSPESSADTYSLWDRVDEKQFYAARSLASLLRESLGPLAVGGYAVVRQAPLAPLTGMNMPAVLVEAGAITHPAVEDRFRDPAYLSALADAICAAVDRFFGP